MSFQVHPFTDLFLRRASFSLFSIVHLVDIILPMSGYEPQISGVGSVALPTEPQPLYISDFFRVYFQVGIVNHLSCERESLDYSFILLQVTDHRDIECLGFDPPAWSQRLRRNRGPGQRRRHQTRQRTIFETSRNWIPDRAEATRPDLGRKGSERGQEEFPDHGFQVPGRREVFVGSLRRVANDRLCVRRLRSQPRLGRRASVSGRQSRLGPGAALLWRPHRFDVRYSWLKNAIIHGFVPPFLDRSRAMCC